MIAFIRHTSLALSLWLLSLSLFAGSAESERLRFSSLSIGDGLSQSTVFSIKQDKKGFLWIGTADGLNRYDGYTFSVYKHSKNDSTTIQSDRIRYILCDRENHIWLGTSAGLSFYDRENNKFLNYPLNTQVNHIFQHPSGLLYVATDNGVFKFDSRNRSFRSLSIGGKNDLRTQIIINYNNLLLVGNTDGLFMSPLEEEYFVPFNKELPGKDVMDALPCAKGLWVATEGDGLYFFDHNGKSAQYKYDKNNRQSISSNYVRSLALDMQERLWAGTFNGLNIFNESANTFDRYYSNEIEKGTISQNSVRSLFLDNQGAVWIGTYYGGLNYYHPFQNRFGRLSHIPYTNSLSDNVVSCITEGRPNELWIGTNDNGINVYDINTQRFTYYTADDNRKFITSNNVKAILADGSNVYAGVHGGGLSHLQRNTGRITRYTTENSELCSNDIYALAKTPDGNIWVGTLGGLMVFNPAAQSFKPFVRDNFKQDFPAKSIYDLFLDSRNRLWIGTETGVFIYSLVTRRLTHFHADGKVGSLSDTHINCICEDSKKRIWIGARSGLNLFDEEKQTFTSWYVENGLPNNTIFGILQDSFGRLWISTNKGLACFVSETEKFRTYQLVDGIQSDQFNNYAYCKTASGEMYFGGINGITHFFPEQLGDNPFTPRTIISQLSLFNKKVRPGDDTNLLTKDISETERVVFAPDQSSFSLTFTVPNYLSAKHNTFAYKLTPFEEDWNYTSDIRTASYSNLPHGNYVFEVKAANSDGKWNNTPATLEISISPHWWQTVVARLMFGLVILAIIYGLVKFSRYRQQMKNQLELERLEKEKTEEINQMKLRFFINISHEFRTPLTLIISPLQEIMTRVTDKWTRDQLKLVTRNTNKLLYLVNQLMDYRRAELGVFELKAVEQDPIPQIEESMKMFEHLVRQKKIDFILENDLEDNRVLHDPHYLELILNNLLSNAFKFTPEGGKINIALSRRQNNFVLQVYDTGCGIPEDHQKRIFERFYQVGTENTGTGIGLSLVRRLVELHHGRVSVESVSGKGSAFYIYLPQDKALYGEQELSSEEPVRTPAGNTPEEILDLIQFPEEEKENLHTDETKPLLLIVEDDAEVRRYLSENFKEILNVETAGDGEEALKTVRESDVDIILSDLMLPVMDGIRLCRAIKQNIRTCHIPVILLTAKTTQQDQLEGLSAGADDYVPKPFNLSILKTKVQNMLKARRRTIEHYSQMLDVDPEKITFNEMDRELLEKAKNVVEKHLSDPEFSVDDFCSEMAMSRSNLHLKLKAVTGESTIDFIRKIRFSRACQLLKDGRYSVAEISAIVGFNTPSYFSTSFKKYFGILPTDYVKEGGNQQN